VCALIGVPAPPSHHCEVSRIGGEHTPMLGSVSLLPFVRSVIERLLGAWRSSAIDTGYIYGAHVFFVLLGAGRSC